MSRRRTTPAAALPENPLAGVLPVCVFLVGWRFVFAAANYFVASGIVLRTLLRLGSP